MNAKKASSEPEIRYSELMKELEQILDDLENDLIDVDELSSRVQRASELIGLCRARLTRSKTEIERVVTDLEALEEEGQAEASNDD